MEDIGYLDRLELLPPKELGDLLLQELYKKDSNLNIEYTKALINAGANLRMNDARLAGWTALHIAAYRGHNEIIELLLESDDILDIRTSVQETTPLMVACNYGRLVAAKILIKAGADLNAKDVDGTTSLMRAVSMKSLDIIELLLVSGADIEARNNDGKTAFILAATYWNKDVMEFLLAAGANPEAKDLYGRDAGFFVI